MIASIEKMPEFTFLTLNGKPLSKVDLLTGRYTILLYFNTECEYCHTEAISIRENIHKLEMIQLLFISPEPIIRIDGFAAKHKLLEYENVIFLHDPEDSFLVRFDAITVPYLLLYDTDQELLQKFEGMVTVETILKSLNRK